MMPLQRGKSGVVAIYCLAVLIMTLRQLVVAKDVETIQGTWRVVSLEKEGRAGEDDTWIIQKNKILFKRDNIVYEEAAYETDSRKRPPTIDFTFATGPAKGETIRGIYLLDKDRLKICYVAPDLPEAGKKKRPTEFSSKPGSGTWLLVLSRVKP